MNEVQKRNNQRKFLEGTVISDKMQKTRVVQVLWSAKHSKYNKVTHNATKYKAHDEENKTKVGDVVLLMETRPLSRDKRWVIVEVVKSAEAGI